VGESPWGFESLRPHHKKRPGFPRLFAFQAGAVESGQRMPALTRKLRQLRDEWETQNLLDPPRAKGTLQLAETRLIEAEPELSALRARRKAIVAEMRGLLERARGS
jgi:hypothetical protein